MYADESDLVKRFGQAEIDNLRAMQSSVNPIDDALQDASEEIDSYVFGVYSLPLPSVPNNLNRIACDIARYRLYYQQPTEEVRKRYDDAISFLKRIQDGKATLAILDENNDVTTESPVRKPATKPVGTTYTGGVFGDATLDRMPSFK